MTKTADPVTAYAKQILSGDIPSCEYVKLACARHMHDLAAGHFVWNLQKVDIAKKFSQLLKHYKGAFAGQTFQPELWQLFIKGSLFGWLRPNGKRRFRFAYVEVPRKNGKTFMAADIGLQGFVLDGEAGAEVYAVATKRDQAKIVWEDAKHMAARSPALDKVIKAYTTGMVFDDTCKFQPLSRDTKSMDGLNTHAAIGDEVHAWEDPMLFRQIKDSMGAREQPYFLLITTAGHNQEGICYQLRKHTLAILNGFEDGSYIDNEFFGIIYTLDPDDDYTDEATWIKANPNLSVSKNLDYLRAEVKLAQQIPSEEFGVLNKQFNIWTAGEIKWLDMERWRACDAEVDLDALAGQPCHLGLDLSSIQDLTAGVSVFPPGAMYDEWAIYPRLYLPEERLQLREREDRVPYLTWKEQGHLLTTPGDVIDLTFIKQDILNLTEQFNVIDAGFDPWKAIEMATSLESEGVEMVQMRQGHATLGAPTLALEKLVLEKAIRHGGHPVLTWMANNTSVIADVNDNIRPNKKGTKSRIDGIVATIMGVGRAMVYLEEPPPGAHIIEL